MVVVRVGSHFGIIWRAFCGAISRSSSGNYEYEFCSSGNGEVRMVKAVSKVAKEKAFPLFCGGGKKSKTMANSWQPFTQKSPNILWVSNIGASEIV